MKNILTAIGLLSLLLVFTSWAAANPFESYTLEESAVTAPIYETAPAHVSAYYWVWRDASNWHLRVSTDGLHHRFRGSVELPEGAIKHFSTVGLQWKGDRVWLENSKRISFDLAVHGGIMGFDWQTEARCGEFNLYLDGKPQPERIFLGERLHTPSTAAFEVCLERK